MGTGNDLQLAVLALAQPADVQLSLYPDLVCKADELALEFDDGLKMLGQDDKFTDEQQASLQALDELLSRMSGEQNASFWTEEALGSDPTWEVVRSMAKAVVASFGWELRRPPPSSATYVRAGPRR